MHCLAIKNKGKIYLVIPNDGIFVSHIVFLSVLFEFSPLFSTFATDNGVTSCLAACG